MVVSIIILIFVMYQWGKGQAERNERVDSNTSIRLVFKKSVKLFGYVNLLFYICSINLKYVNMVVLRQVGNVQLNEGQLMAKGLNNLFNTETEQVSLWFDDEVKDSMLKLSDEAFLEVARVQFNHAEIQP